MLIDCDRCEVRGDACGDCVVSVMLGGSPVELTDPEHVALGVLADAGLVPRLRHRRAVDGDGEPGDGLAPAAGQ